MTGPTSVSSSQPTPSRSFSAAATRRDCSASYTPSCTITRDAAVQRWPDVPNADQRIPSTASSTSASSRTTIAFLPPSSRWTCFSPSAALRITSTPVSHEPVSDRAAAAVHDVEHAGRQSGLREQLDEALTERRCVSGGFEDDGVAADERGRDLPGRDRDREVPRRDRADDADRLPHAHVELVAQLGRSRLAEQAPPFPGHVEAHVDRLLHVAAGLGLHLPHLVAHQVGEVVLLLGEEIREAVQNLAALRCGHEPPLLERGLRRLDRAVDVLGARAREDPDR